MAPRSTGDDHLGPESELDDPAQIAKAALVILAGYLLIAEARLAAAAVAWRPEHAEQFDHQKRAVELLRLEHGRLAEAADVLFIIALEAGPKPA